MSKKANLAVAMSTVMGLSVVASPLVQAKNNPFGMKELSQASAVQASDEKGGEGKCGDKKGKEGKCGEKKDTKKDD